MIFKEFKGRTEKQLHSQGFCNEHKKILNFFGGRARGGGGFEADFRFPRGGGGIGGGVVGS